MKNRIITISREFGSDGRTIGKKVAEQLRIPCYDSELIQKIAQESGFTESYVRNADESASSGFLGSAFSSRTFGPTNEDYLWSIQQKVILDLAEKGPCVIVGRCADYVLRENKNCLHVYVYANHFTRMDRIIKQYGVDPAKAADTLVKQDKQRANYYNFYSNQKWGNPENYDLLVDSSAFGIENSIDLICQAVEMKEKLL